jgi:hypothetical protein
MKSSIDLPGTLTEQIPRIFHVSGCRVPSLFRIGVRSSFWSHFEQRNNFKSLMVGATGIEPVTPPV